MGHVRENLNPLAADDHMKEVIQQLQLMGEVVTSLQKIYLQILLLPFNLLNAFSGLLLY